MSEQDLSQSAASARAAVRLIESLDAPCYIQTTSDAKVQIDGQLVSIDGVTGRGKSTSELENLLWGAPNSSVEIVWLQQDAIQRTSLIREVVKIEHLPLSGLAAKINQLNDEYGAPEPSSLHAFSSEQQNLDLVAIGFLRKSLRYEIGSAGRTSTPGGVTARLVILFDTLGLMTQADICLKLLLSNPSFDLDFDLTNGPHQNQSMALVDHLILTGRADEAIIFCKQFLKYVQENTGNANIPVELSSQVIRIKLAEALVASRHHSDALPVVRDINDVAVSVHIPPELQRTLRPWLIRTLIAFGEVDRAIRYIVRSWPQHNWQENPPTLFAVQEYGYQAIKFAYIQIRNGQCDSANTVLQIAISGFDALPPDVKDSSEKMAGLFPTQSDLQTELARSYLCQDKYIEAKFTAELAIARIEDANGFECPSLQTPLEIMARVLKRLNDHEAAAICFDRAINIFELQNHQCTPVEQYETLRKSLSAIEDKNFDRAKELGEQLLEIYRKQTPLHEYEPRALNLFCAILNLARKLADSGCYRHSNKLLLELALVAANHDVAPIALEFLHVERRYNDARHAEIESLTPISDRGVNNPLLPNNVPPLLGAESARTFSELYAAADEPARALFVYQNVLAAKEKLSLCRPPDGTTNINNERSNAVFLLAAARLRCLNGQLSQAFSVATEALASRILLEGEFTQPDLLFLTEYRNEVIQLAEAFKDAGADSVRIVQFLQDCLATLGSATGDSAYSPTARQVSLIDAYIHRFIAYVLHSSGMDMDALPHVWDFIHNLQTWTDVRAHILAAEIFEANNLMEEAAHQYSFAGMHEKAFDTIKKATGVNPRGEVKIILQLAEAKRWQAPQQSLALYEEASSKIPDSSPEKANLLGAIINMKQECAPRAHFAEGVYSQWWQAPGNMSLNLANPHISEQNRLGVARQYASFAEMHSQADTWKKLIVLAALAAKARLFDEAIACARRALKLHLRRFDEVLCSDGEALIAHDGFPKYVAEDAKYKDDIENILQEAVDRCASLYGKDSVPVSAQLLQNLEFFLDRNDEIKAMKVLEQLLQVKLRNLECIGYCVGVHGNRIGDKALLLAMDRRYATAINILHRLLGAQRTSLDTDDERIASTLLYIARVQYSQKEIPVAEKSVLQAIEIYRLYVGDERITTHESGDLLLQIWKEAGRAADAKIIDVGSFKVCPALLSKLGNNSLAEAVSGEDVGKVAAAFVDPLCILSKNRKRPEHTSNTNEVIQQWKKEYAESQRQAAYSDRTSAALDALVAIAHKATDWQLLAEVASARAKLFEHRIDPSAGRSTTGTTLAGSRIDFYLLAASAYLHLNMQAEGRGWLERAAKTLPALTYGEQLRLAGLALELDDKSVARGFAESANSELKANPSVVTAYNSEEAAAIWRRLGEPNRAIASPSGTSPVADNGSEFHPGPGQWRQIKEEDRARESARQAEEKQKRMVQLEADALIAENGNEGTAIDLWMRLIFDEIREQQFDKAISHLERAINFESITAVYDMYGRMRFNVERILDLGEAGRVDDAERLLLARANKMKNIFGPNSSHYTAQLATLCKLYIMAKNETQLDRIFDDLLAVDSRKQELNGLSSGVRAQLFEVLREVLDKDFGNQAALDKLKKLIAAQRASHGSDDSTVATMLRRLASAESCNGNVRLSEDLIREADSIEMLYLSSDSRSSLFVFRKDQRDFQSDDEQLTDSRGAAPQLPLSAHYDMVAVQNYYETLHQRAPFSEGAIDAAQILLKHAQEEKDWVRVRAIAADLLKALSHTSMLAPRGCILREAPANKQFDAYRAIIEACLRLGRADEAHYWQKKATEEESYSPGDSELFFLAEISNAVGEKEQALTYAKRADEHIRSFNESRRFYLGAIANLFRMIGSHSDCRRIIEESESLQTIDHEEKLAGFEQETKLYFRGLPTPEEVSVIAKMKRDEPELFIEPGKKLISPRPERISDKYLLNYVAIAQEALWLNSAHVLKYPGHDKSYSFAGAHEAINCDQAVHDAGHLLFLYDGPPETLMPESPNVVNHSDEHAADESSNGPRIFTGAPPVMARPYRSALAEPQNATSLSGSSSDLILEPGDYVVEGIFIKSLVLSGSGPVRIFLRDFDNVPSPLRGLYLEHFRSYLSIVDQIPDEKPVFETAAHSCIDVVPGHDALSIPSRLEIWYDGVGEIRLGAYSNFKGIVYAPNATVRLGQRVHFIGAIVADIIVAGEKSRLIYDPSLQDWQSTF